MQSLINTWHQQQSLLCNNGHQGSLFGCIKAFDTKMNHHLPLWSTFSATCIFICYFSSSSRDGAAADFQMGIRIAVAAIMAALAFAVKSIFFSGGFTSSWKLFCACTQFVTSCSLFLLVCQQQQRSLSSSYASFFPLLSIVEHCYTLPLLGVCRIAAPHLIRLQQQQQCKEKNHRLLDMFLGVFMGPLCAIILFSVQSSSSSSMEKPVDLESWQSWVLFLLLVVVHLTPPSSSSSGGNAASSAEAAAGLVVKGLLLCVGIACFHVRKRNNAEMGGGKGNLMDYNFFRTLPSSSAGELIILQLVLLLWLGLCACRWYVEVCNILFFSSDVCGCAAALNQGMAEKCIRCLSVETMKEDVDDACASLAVAGILAGAYAISSSSSSLEEKPRHDNDDDHDIHTMSMLDVVGSLAAVIVAVNVLQSTVGLYFKGRSTTTTSPSSSLSSLSSCSLSQRHKQHFA